MYQYSDGMKDVECKQGQKCESFVLLLPLTADGQIEVSEFVANVHNLRGLSLVGHCNRWSCSCSGGK